MFPRPQTYSACLWLELVSSLAMTDRTSALLASEVWYSEAVAPALAAKTAIKLIPIDFDFMFFMSTTPAFVVGFTDCSGFCLKRCRTWFFVRRVQRTH